MNVEFYDLFSVEVMSLAVTLTRLAIAFLVLPLFSSQIIPPLVRNSIFVSLGLIILNLQEKIDLSSMTGVQLVHVFAGEALVGLSIGIFFGLFLWAFEAAGEVIDTAVGSSMAMVFDPISGNEVTLIGDFLGRWTNYMFLASGGLLLVTGVLFESYSVFPVGALLLTIDSANAQLFIEPFTNFFSMTIMIAAPALVIILIVDMSMGLVNRFAQQLNVLFLSISIKALVALLLLLLLIPTLTSLLLAQLDKNAQSTLDSVKLLFGL